MAENTQKYAPVAVYLMVNDGNAALDFYRRAFGADVTETYPYEGKLGHATLKINGGEVMLSDEFPESITGVRSPKSLGGTTCTVSLTVDDADIWFPCVRARKDMPDALIRKYVDHESPRIRANRHESTGMKNEIKSFSYSRRFVQIHDLLFVRSAK